MQVDEMYLEPVLVVWPTCGVVALVGLQVRGRMGVS